MKTLRSLLLVILSLTFSLTDLAQANFSQNESSWIGTYNYAFALDRNPNSGYADTIEYSLKIFRRENKVLVRYKADGLRTWDDYECTVEISGNQLNLYYAADLRDGELGSSNRNLKKGQFLGSLVKTVVRGKVKYTLKNAPLVDLVRNPVFKKKA